MTDQPLTNVEERTEKAIAEFKPNPAFVAAGALLPTSYKQVMELATIMCKSNIVPKDLNGRPEACAVAIMFGMEVGLTPTQAMQNIMVVNNRPSLWGDAIKALIIGSGKCELFDEDPPHKALAQKYGRCRLVRKKEFGGGEVEIQFSVEDAQRAKLWSKEGPWQTYPGRMLMFRARGWAARDLFPDVLKGMQMREEVEDYQIVENAKKVDMPQKRAEMAPGATIVDAEVATPQTPENVQPSATVAATPGAQEGQATAKPDRATQIDETRRRALWKMWDEKGIKLDEVKQWCAANKVASTTELTWEQGDDLETWILQHK